jgi:NADPH2:quinone reductase
LRGIGAKYVCNATSPTFLEDLTQALVDTGATLAFDATGGGKLAGQILGCMEAALNRTAKEYSRYGSTTHKQVYIYGGLDRSPTEFVRNFGMTWGMGGWLLFPFLQKLGAEGTQRAVVAERRRGLSPRPCRMRSLRAGDTTQASRRGLFRCSKGLAGRDADLRGCMGRQAIVFSAEKFLLNPHKGRRPP